MGMAQPGCNPLDSSWSFWLCPRHSMAAQSASGQSSPLPTVAAPMAALQSARLLDSLDLKSLVEPRRQAATHVRVLFAKQAQLRCGEKGTLNCALVNGK